MPIEMPMPTQADLDAANVYAAIMEEAKLRALSINMFSGAGYAIPLPLKRECCFLQLRMLCELIALGCLVAHQGHSILNYFRFRHTPGHG